MEIKRIESIQGYRMMLFLTIFFFHCGGILKETVFYEHLFAGGGVQAVAYFFVLSGFVAALSDKNKIVSVKEYISYIRKRYVQFARYHIPFLAAVLPLMVLMILQKPVFYACCFICNIFLVQSWWPNLVAILSFNSVAWFLSTLLFLYGVAPVLQRLDYRLKYKAVDRILIILLCCILAVVLSVNIHANYGVWLYAFPPTRLLDFTAGFFCGKYFVSNRNKTWSTSVATGLELIFSIWYICLLAINISLPENIRQFAIYMPGAVMTVYIIAKGTGVLSRWLSKPWVVRLGNRTLYYMICHQVFLRYMTQIYKRLLGELEGLGVRWFCVIASVGIVIISEPVFEKVMKRLDGVKRRHECVKVEMKSE